MGQHVNGYPIMRQAVTKDKRAAVIMVDRGSRSRERYVTAYLENGADSWDLGHYFSEMGEALADYHERCLRNC